MAPEPPFAAVVSRALEASGLTLRGLCRECDLDPSFFSKVLAGKRNPPSEEPVLRRIARVLSLDEAELIVSAGRIPSEWQRLWSEPELFQAVHREATLGAKSPRVSTPKAPKPSFGRPSPARESSREPAPAPVLPSRALSEELL